MYAVLFFTIFLAKMVITCMPIFFQNFDKETFIQIVLQLEIENNKEKSGMSEQVKEFMAKDYPKPVANHVFLMPSCITNESDFVFDEDQHVRAFYPSVPTPPPNS